MARILVVEDEADLLEMLTVSLQQQNHEVVPAHDARAAWSALVDVSPDLILLDWMLPDAPGIEILRRMRRTESLKEIPVIMLTARSNEHDRVRGLDTGADDYVVKPFSFRELHARIRTQLRRGPSRQRSDVVECCGMRMDVGNHRVSVDGQALDLGPLEFRILRHFLIHPDQVFSRSQLLDHVWGRGVYVLERTVDVHIRRLRKALEPVAKDGLIQTVRGAGYRLSTD